MRIIGKSVLFFLFIAMSLGILSCVAPKEPSRDLIFYFFESCPSCDDYILAEEYSGKIDKLNKKNKWNGSHHNLIVPQAADELKTTLKEKKLPDVSRSLPLLIIGSEYINGYQQIGEKLDELLSE